MVTMPSDKMKKTHNVGWCWVTRWLKVETHLLNFFFFLLSKFKRIFDWMAFYVVWGYGQVLILMFKKLVANLVGLNFNIRKLGQHSGEEKTLMWFPLMTAIMKLWNYNDRVYQKRNYNDSFDCDLWLAV